MKLGSFTGRSRFDSIVKSSRMTLRRILGQQSDEDLWEQMHSNSIAKSANQKKAAIEWFRDYCKNRKNQIHGEVLKPGQLYMYDYDTPKWESVLDYWDTRPLMIVLGYHLNKEDSKIRELGINLHLLPPRVRKLALFRIYGMYQAFYRGQYGKSQRSSKFIEWQLVKKQLDDLGIGFAVRMYIPQLRRNTIEFDVSEWHNAIWIPSKSYAKITEAELEIEWRKYVKQHKLKNLITESHIS